MRIARVQPSIVGALGNTGRVCTILKSGCTESGDVSMRSTTEGRFAASSTAGIVRERYGKVLELIRSRYVSAVFHGPGHSSEAVELVLFHDAMICLCLWCTAVSFRYSTGVYCKIKCTSIAGVHFVDGHIWKQQRNRPVQRRK